MYLSNYILRFVWLLKSNNQKYIWFYFNDISIYVGRFNVIGKVKLENQLDIYLLNLNVKVLSNNN